MAGTFVTVLRYRDFLKIWISQLTSQTALNMLNFALILHIYQLTGSTTTISLVLIASAIPSVILGPFSGVFADRFNYKKILTYTNFLRFFAVLLLLFAQNNVLALLEIIFIISSVAQFFAPAEQASIPLIVPKHRLIGANSVIVTTTYATLLIGYSVAGPIMRFTSTSFLFLICGLLYLIATLSINSMTNYDLKKIKKITLSTLAIEFENIWKSTKEGIAYGLSNRPILRTLIKLAAGWVALGSFLVLLPGFGTSILKLPADLVGPYVIAPAGIGMIIAAYILDKRKRVNLDSASNWSFIGVGITLFLFAAFKFYHAFAFSRVIVTIIAIGLGFGCSILYISSQTFLHLKTEEKLRGRVFGLAAMLINLAISIPALVVGGISDATSPFVAMIALSIGIFAFGVFVNYRYRSYSGEKKSISIIELV